MKPIRLQKFLAQAGIASRRKAEELIATGKVLVNGAIVTKLGTTVNPETDKVSIGKRRVRPTAAKTVIAVYKPYGILSTTKVGRERGQAVTELVPHDTRLFIAGRLDRESEGLLILTDDGDLALTISHPRYGHEKEYQVETQEHVEPTRLRLFEHGVRVGQEVYQAKRAWRSGTHQFHIILTTGHKHQVRRMADAAHLTVTRLKRVRIGGLTLAGLQPGGWRALSAEEIGQLREPTSPRRYRRW